MSSPRLKRYRVLFWQTSRCKAEVSAASEEDAMAFVDDALANGDDLDFTVYDGENDVVDAFEIAEEGMP